MLKVARNDIFAKSETGGEVFDEFLRICKDQKNILDAVLGHKVSVDDVVNKYKAMVGLDLLDSKVIFASTSISPIAPMRLKKVDKPDDVLEKYDDSDIIVQIKYDGFKSQAIKNSNGKVSLYTRRGEDFTPNVPMLVSQLEKLMPKDSFLLGELVWEEDGKQSISDIQTVVASSVEKAAEKLKEKNGKVIFYVYDLLWDSGTDITKEGYVDRYDKLKKILENDTSNIKLVKNYSYSNLNKVIDSALKVNAEGVVLKPKKSEYKYAARGENEPFGDWVKFKPKSKANVDEVILKEYSKGKDKLIFPAYQYKGAELFEVGKLSGMSKKDEAGIKKRIDDGDTVVVEITFQEKMPSGKFRHIGWSRLRPDKPVKEVKYSKAGTTGLSYRKAGDLSHNPEIEKIIDSFCEHSGGTKSTHSIISYLRDKFGNELIQFSDRDLIDYIENRKNKFKSPQQEEMLADVGKVGLENTYEDQAADYILHGK